MLYRYRHVMKEKPHVVLQAFSVSLLRLNSVPSTASRYEPPASSMQSSGIQPSKYASAQVKHSLTPRKMSLSTGSCLCVCVSAAPTEHHQHGRIEPCRSLQACKPVSLQ